MTVFAIIGGTGLEALPGLQLLEKVEPATPYGEISQPISRGELAGRTIYFLHRHGAPGAIPPHLINYRANLWALHSLAVTDVIAINAVGGIHPKLPAGSLLLPDQLIDYSWGREHSFDSGENGALQHIDFTQPYDQQIRDALQAAAQRAAVTLTTEAVHGITQGPRLETAAEIQRLRRDGCDVVGMTGMPEAALARELGMRYVCIAMVVNAAAGIGSEQITLDSMRKVLGRNTQLLSRLLAEFFRADQSN